MHSSLPLDAFGGRFNSEQGQILTTTDVDRIGAFSVTSLLNFLALLFWDESNSRAISGFPREQLDTDACKTTGTSALGFSVSTGWGLFWNASSTADDFEPHRYLPVVLDTAHTGTLAAHDATHPRIDLVCIAPAWESDVPESRNVKNPSTGVVSSSSIDARRRFSSTIQVVTGTPATPPAAPSVPAGYMEIARATVPASSGAAVWEDTRPVLQLGHFFSGLPRHAVDDYVPLGGASELEVVETSPASLGVEVTRGRSSINGVVRFYKTTTLTLSAAHASLDRIDLIVAKADNTLAVVAGTPHASPSAPALPAASIPLAEVLVEATVTSVSNAKITDRRQREPFNGSTKLQKATTNWDRLDEPAVKAKLGAATVSGDEVEIPLELFYPDGTTEYEGPFDDATPNRCAFLVEVLKVVTGPALSAPFSGSSIGTDFVGGSLTMPRLEPIAEYAAGTYISPLLVWYKPDNFDADDYNQGSGPGASGVHRFWCPERTGAIKLARGSGLGTTGTFLVVVHSMSRPGACSANATFTLS